MATALGSGGIGTTFVGITTAGDLDQRQLTEIGGTGVFVSAVRDALRRGEIDVAVLEPGDAPQRIWRSSQFQCARTPATCWSGDDSMIYPTAPGSVPELHDVPCKSSTGPPAMSFGSKLCRFETSRPGSSGPRGKVDAVILAAAGCAGSTCARDGVGHRRHAREAAATGST